MKLLIIVLTILITSCGNLILPADSRVHGGSPNDNAYVEGVIREFLSDCDKYKVKCDNSYTTTNVVSSIQDDESINGVCTQGFVRNSVTGETQLIKSIQLRQDMITGRGVTAKALIYHELNHCLRMQAHFDTYIDLMNTFSTEKEELLTVGWDRLVDLAFSRDVKYNIEE